METCTEGSAAHLRSALGNGDVSTEDLSRSIAAFVSEAATLNVNRLRESPTETLKTERTKSRAFEERLGARWGRALDLFEVVVELGRVEGSRFNDTFRPAASADDDFVFDALTHLHAWATTVASEVLVLLRSGYGAGAHARARTLHEIAVTGVVINEGGQGVAERFLRHDAVVAAKDALEFQRYADLANEQPLDDQTFDELQRARDHLVAEYGPEYRGTYGWAADFLAVKRPTFFHLEKHVVLNQWRLYYSWACHRVHPSSKAMRLNTVRFRDQEAMGCGPSNAGLADPAQHALWAYVVISSSLLATREGDPATHLRFMVAEETIRRLANDAVEHFVALERGLAEEERVAQALNPNLPPPWARGGHN